MPVKTPECADCLTEGITAWRPIASGTRVKRCATHTRIAKKASKLTAQARQVQTRYGISQEAYWALYEAQGGACAICQVATGKTKRLAVDHDHGCQEGHDPKTGCPKCIRGLLCGACNQLVGRYTNEALARAVAYKLDPPAPAVLGRFANLDLDEPEPVAPSRGLVNVIVPEPPPPGEAFWLWTPFDEETGQLDTPRLEQEGWTWTGALREDTPA